jgi:hypothetical protein
MNNNTAKNQAKITAQLTKAISRAEAKLELFEEYPVVFSTTCWASTSNKPVFQCWCAQCKEIVTEVAETGYLPAWFQGTAA